MSPSDVPTGPAPVNPVLEVIRRRRSIRAYLDRQVPEEALEAVLEAARWAPSAVNSQPWQFVVVTDPDRRRLLGEIARFYFLRYRHVGSAPAIIAVLGRPTANRWYQIDCALAAANIMLAAESLGLGTCYVGGFSVPAARRILGLAQPAAPVLTRRGRCPPVEHAGLAGRRSHGPEDRGVPVGPAGTKKQHGPRTTASGAVTSRTAGAGPMQAAALGLSFSTAPRLYPAPPPPHERISPPAGLI